MVPNNGNPRRTLLICLILAATTFAAFSPVLQNDFIKLDDHQYVLENPHVLSGLTWSNIKWAFQSGYASNWHPLTWISHMLDVQWFGLNPKWHHLMNLLFHIANSVLLFLALQSMTKAPWRSAFVAALFALHPLHVESVAWVAERKDVLSTFFLMLTLIAYARYVEAVQSPKPLAQSARRNHVWFYYGLALFLFALGLMSKPMLVTTPFLLLLLDVWPLQRAEVHLSKLKSFLPLIIEKIPFFILCTLSSAMTFHAQNKGHSVSVAIPISSRVANAIASYMKYLGKMIWPTELSPFYPHPDLRYPLSTQWPDWLIFTSTLLLIVISIIAVRRLKSQPWLAIGWFWFLGTLIPVIGIVQVGAQAMADRYAYIPSIGFFLTFVWVTTELATSTKIRKSVWCIAGISALAICSSLTFRQSGFWKNNFSLFQHALAVSSDNPVAHYYVGVGFGEQDNPEAAAEHFQKATQLYPGFSDAFASLGTTLVRMGKIEEAADQYRQALQIAPNDVIAHNGLAMILWKQGHLSEAIEEYNRTLQLKPDYADGHYNLGLVHVQAGNQTQALFEFKNADELKPNDPEIIARIAGSLATLGRFSEAETNLINAIHLNSTNVEFHVALAEIQRRLAKFEDSLSQLQSAIRFQTNNAALHYRLGETLVAMQRPDEALEQFSIAQLIQPDYPAAWLGEGKAAILRNDPDRAERAFRQFLRLAPTEPEAYLSLGKCLMLENKTNEARKVFTDFQQLAPDFATKTLSNGISSLESGELETAIANLTTLTWIQPTNADGHKNLGLAFAKTGNRDDAIRELQSAVNLRGSAEDFFNLGLVQLIYGEVLKSIRNHQEAIRLKPYWTIPLNNLAWVLATSAKPEIRNGTEAVQLAEKACALDGTQARFWGTLDAAYAEAGRFEDAIRTAEKTKELAEASGEKAVIEAAKVRLELYRKRQPYHQESREKP